MVKTRTIDWGGGEVTARVAGTGPDGILLAHGAGADQDHPAISGLRDGLAEYDLTVMTFNYPYTERGSKSPDRRDKLETCHTAVAGVFLPEVDRLFLAGRSMGGRIGTHVAASGGEADGLILYAYPLHPANKPESLRIEQFDRISVPMLFMQGTKDSLSRMELFNQYIAPLTNATVDLLEGAGHGPRGGGWNQETMTARYVKGTVAWLSGI